MQSGEKTHVSQITIGLNLELIGCENNTCVVIGQNVERVFKPITKFDKRGIREKLGKWYNYLTYK